MTAVFAVPSRPRKRLVTFAVSFFVASLLGTGVAHAAAVIFPSVKGAGSITGTSTPFGILYGPCTNSNQNENVVIGCASGTFNGIFAPPFLNIPAIVTLTATPSGTPAGNWRFSRWFNCPSGDFDPICTMVVFGGGVVNFFPQAVFDDFRAPTVTALTTNFSTTVDRGVNWSFTADESLSAINCSVDGGAFVACSTVRTFSEGTHTVRAQGTDFSGQVGGISGNLATFRIVDTQLISGPADFSPVKRPTFTYSTIAGINFQCSIDNVAVTTPCGTKDAAGRASFTPPANLADGAHTFRVRALDGPEFDRVPVSRTWTVDSVLPTTTLASPTITDGIVTTLLNATFTFTASETLNRFECKLDAEAFAACTSPRNFSDLPFGQHTFSVRGVDRAGNVGATQSRTWTVSAKDTDGDGFNQRSDCNDDDPRINPIAPDVPDNGVDENCDGADAINLDRDGDGFQRPGDCDDGNPAIRPGVADTPDNGVDENCDGADTKTPPPPPLPSIASTVNFNFALPGKKFTKFTKFQVRAIPAGSTVTARCKKCGKKPPKQTKKNAKGNVTLKKFQRKFKVGSIIEVRVTKKGMIGIVKQVKVLKKKNPVIATKCLPPGASKPVKCG